MKYILLFILTSWIWMGCTPKPIVIPKKPDTSGEDSVVIWKMPILPDTSARGLIDINMFLYADKYLLYSTGSQGNPYNFETLKMMDVETKEITWEWTVKQLQSSEIVGDNLYINANRTHYCLDLATGEVLWENSHPDISGEPFTSSYKDLIFSLQDYGDMQEPSHSDIRMANIQTGDWRIVFSADKNAEGYSAPLQAPACYFNDDGDTILVFHDRRYSHQLNPWYKIELIAYNVTQQTIVWENLNISNEVSNIGNPPRIDEVNKRVYFYTDETAFCYDLETGEEIWKVDSGLGGNLGGIYFLHDGKLMTINDGGMYMALDAETGEILFSVKQGGGGVENARIYGDRMYFTDYEIFIADIHTGKRTWKYPGVGAFWGGVAVDEPNKVMYAADYYYLYCLKLPEY